MLCKNSFLVFLSILTHSKHYSSPVASGATVGGRREVGREGNSRRLFPSWQLTRLVPARPCNVEGHLGLRQYGQQCIMAGPCDSKLETAVAY